MLATVIVAPGEIEVIRTADPSIEAPTDAIVRITHCCICGSDLWAYRGVAHRGVRQPIGHEFIGIVEETGSEVTTLRKGDAVVAPFSWACGKCDACRRGLPTSCPLGGFWGRTTGAGGAQAEAIRVPFADATLVAVPRGSDSKSARALLGLTDILCTGYHAALCANVSAGETVAVVGDGPVGLCAVMIARHLGAGRIFLFGRHASRLALGLSLGATDAVNVDTVDPAQHIRDLNRGFAADSVLECVGTEMSLRTSVLLARDGGAVGYVGVPHSIDKVPLGKMFGRNIGLRGGIAPSRTYIPRLLPSVLNGALDASSIFDLALPLAEAAQGYQAMNCRQATKVMLTI